MLVYKINSSLVNLNSADFENVAVSLGVSFLFMPERLIKEVLMKITKYGLNSNQQF